MQNDLRWNNPQTLNVENLSERYCSISDCNLNVTEEVIVCINTSFKGIKLESFNARYCPSEEIWYRPDLTDTIMSSDPFNYGIMGWLPMPKFPSKEELLILSKDMN